MTKYPYLFSPMRLGAHVIKNRIALPAMGSCYCTDSGEASKEMANYYAARARGGCGLIITEFTSVDYPNGMGVVSQVSLSSDDKIPGFAALADAVKPYGAKVIAQLHHAGMRAVKRPDARLVGPTTDVDSGVHGMTGEEIRSLVQKFAKAAKRAQLAGLDGVEIHAGHGYLVGQFLSPATNKRSDEYGGNAENRARFLCEIIKAIREACGSTLLLSARLAIKDWDPSGMKLEEGIEVAKIVDALGLLDLINITTGVKYRHIGAMETQDRPDGARIELAKALRPEVKTPLAIVGKLRTGEMCNSIIEDGIADMVVVGRQQLCDPEWANKLRDGKDDEVRPCISCLECYDCPMAGQRMRCVLNPTAGFESEYDELNIPKAAKSKKVVVVGGGIAGMQAAVTAAQRGHKVTLIERNKKLGGQIAIASAPPDKDLLNKIIPYFEKRLKQAKVSVKTGVEATIENILEYKPDAVLLAIGSQPSVPPVPGAERAVIAWDVLSGKVKLPKGKDVVVIGGGIVGSETALHLLTGKNRVAILEMLPKIAPNQQSYHRARDMSILAENEVLIETSCRVESIGEGTVAYVNSAGEAQEVKADLVVMATGQKPSGSVDDAALSGAGVKQVVRLGDAVQAGNFRASTRSAFLQAYAL